jgi:hypothetical protein
MKDVALKENSGTEGAVRRCQATHTGLDMWAPQAANNLGPFKSVFFKCMFSTYFVGAEKK